MFQSTEVEAMSTAIPRRNEMQRVGGPYLGCRAELEMPRRGKGGRQTAHTGGNTRVHLVHFFEVDFFLKIIYFFCDFFPQNTYRIKVPLVGCFNAKSKRPHFFLGQVRTYPHCSRKDGTTSVPLGLPVARTPALLSPRCFLPAPRWR